MYSGLRLSICAAGATIAASVFFAAPAFASVGTLLGSSYSMRHQEKIVRAVEKECGAFEQMRVLKENEEKIMIDQGITDVWYQTILNVSINGVDRVVVVKSYYGDHYDHVGRNWGAYGIESVDCFATR
jgi:hypothetical protein